MCNADIIKISKLHVRQPLYLKRVKNSLSVIQEALNNYPGKWWVSFSGGKDSLVLLDLCIKLGWRGDLFHIFHGHDTTDMDKIILYYKSKHDLQLKELHFEGELAFFEKIGGFFIHGHEKEVNKYKRDWKKDLIEFQEKENITGNFIGLRAGESKYRRIVFKKKGYIYTTEDRNYVTCCPLFNWDLIDIWTYILNNELKYLDKYNKDMNDRSEEIFFWCESAWRHGYATDLKVKNPKLYFELISKYPEMSRWS